VIFDDVQSNVILAAIMVYMAAEEPEMVSRKKRNLTNPRTGEPMTWPTPKSPTRKGGVD
jgi:carboxypeptidase Q